MRVRRSRKFAFALSSVVAPLLVVSGALMGCSALLGVKDIYLDADAAAGVTPALDGSSDGNVTGDGPSVNDGGTEAGPCDATMLQTDPSHCGRCGHSCGGGMCVTGKCEAVTLATGLGGPDGLALGASDVYVTLLETASVLAIPKSGGQAKQLATNETRARGVATFANTLYWANGDFTFDDAGAKGGVWQCTLPACSDKKVLAPSGYDTSYPVVHGPFVYWGAGEDGTVKRVALTGGASTVIANTSHAFGLAVDDAFAYYTSSQPTLHRAHVDGSSVGSEEALGAANGTGAKSLAGLVALDADRLYWTFTDDNGVGHVSSAAKSAPVAGSIVYGGAIDNLFPVGIAVDDANVYWSTGGTFVSVDVPAGDGKVFACPKAGCPAGGPTVIATGNLSSGPLAVDDSGVYWVEYGAFMGSNGRVRRVAKP
jgi:hypothetical protein